MDSRPLDVRVETRPGEAVIRFEGRIDRDADEALAGAYASATAGDARVVALEFGAVEYINSTGIALIVRLLADARREGREVRARGLSEHYREIFRITRLSDFMTIEDGASATAAMGGRDA